MAIELIAIDMDGTLLNPQHQITPAVKQALIANTEGSVARGAFGSPSFFVGETPRRSAISSRGCSRRTSWDRSPAPWQPRRTT